MEAGIAHIGGLKYGTTENLGTHLIGTIETSPFAPPVIFDPLQFRGIRNGDHVVFERWPLRPNLAKEIRLAASPGAWWNPPHQW